MTGVKKSTLRSRILGLKIKRNFHAVVDSVSLPDQPERSLRAQIAVDRAEKNFAAFAAHIQTPFGVQALTLLVVVAAWEFIGRTGLLFPELFPSVLEILQSLWLYISTPLMRRFKGEVWERRIGKFGRLWKVSIGPEKLK